jgi:hypothetical protein
MHRLSTALRRVADVLDVTEPEALSSYLAHAKAHKCNANRCETAWKLHDQWVRAQARQSAEGSAKRRGGPLVRIR